MPYASAVQSRIDERSCRTALDKASTPVSAARHVTIFLTASVAGASAALWPPQLLARAPRTHAISGTREQKQDSKRSGKIVSLNAVAVCRKIGRASCRERVYIPDEAVQ